MTSPSNVNLVEAFEQVEFNEASREDLERIVKAADYYAMILNSTLYNCAEKTLAIRRLQESVFWARDAIKAHQIRSDRPTLNGCEATP